jgi:translocator protein
MLAAAGRSVAATRSSLFCHPRAMTALDRIVPAPEPSALRRRLGNIVIAASPLAVGGVSGALTAPAIRTWYRSLDRPRWNPPDAVFGPVWTTLYAAMGIALLRVAKADRSAAARRLAIGLFGAQLALNFGWSWIFFVQREIGAAALEILALWLAIVATIAAFARVAPSAAALLVPYLAWVTFAAALNVAIWRLNR